MQLYSRQWRMRTPYDASPVDQVIDSFAYLAPDCDAVSFGENNSYTFAQMKERSDNLAARLMEKGVKVGDVVAFMPKRDGDMIVTMLAILKAGAAYLPVEPTFPEDRVRYMLETAKAKLMLFHGGIMPPKDMPCEICEADFSGGVSFSPPGGRSPEDPFNVLYTSGSTGQPKGVMMVHKSISNLLAHVEPLLAGENTRMLCASSCVFDVFTTEALLCLATGRCAVIADEEEMLLPWKLAKRIEDGRADVIQLTPSRLRMCLANEEFCKALSRAKSVILLGEPWTLSLRDRIKELTNGRIFNIYGPTETSVHNCQGDVTDSDCIHIGLPIGNCRYYLLDKDRRLLPPTATGEIYIAGECLAAGYVSREDLTAKAYLPDPFYPGERMYKTGDIGRMRADGTWQCLGRTDSQLKLNGHRIEPAEIAAQIMLSPFAKEAAVLPVIEDGIPRSLRAYIVPSENYSDDKIAEYLYKKLPDYMVPSSFVTMDAMPRTASGKTDLKVLAAIMPGKKDSAVKVESTAEKADVVAPKLLSAAEERLGKLWTQALGKAPDKETPFFAQGGTSLTAIIILNHYHQQGIPISLNDFYSTPTLAAQARMLEEADVAQTISAAPAEPEQGETEKLARYIPHNEASISLTGNVLLTGATGFLGAHLLRELLDSGAEKVVCMVRGEAERRLEDALTYYFGAGFYLRNRRRIVPVSGDITEGSRLGMDESTYYSLRGEIDAVVHSAADVRHFAPWQEIERVNVTGTRNMIAFAMAAGAPLIHISTVSVAGEYLVDMPEQKALLTEHDLDIGQNWRENLYVRSKAMAEDAVARAMREGLNAKMFRVGRLVSRRSDGLFQPNAASNAFYRDIKAIADLGYAPMSYFDLPLELTEVDLCARAVISLAGRPGGMFHAFNPKMLKLSELLRPMKNVRFLSDQVFALLLKEAVKQKNEGRQKEFYYSLAETYFSKSLKEPAVKIDSGITVRALLETGFEWPKPDPMSIAFCFGKSETGGSL